MGNRYPSIIMSSSMNMAVTIFGFVLSAMFMLVICSRLLCARIRQRHVLGAYQADGGVLGSGSVEWSVHGIEPSVVASFPTIKYNQQVFTSSEDNLCAICLADYKEKEVLLVLPGCGHAFHVNCIDLWLRQHSTCPVCRISLRVFLEWRRKLSPFISCAARSRFFPGALPDCLFEQPYELQSPVHILEHSAHASVSIDCVPGPIFTESVNVEARELLLSGLEGESSSTELACTEQSGDGQQFREFGSSSLPNEKDNTTIFLLDTFSEEGSKMLLTDSLCQ